MSDPKHRIQRILNIIAYVRKNAGVPIEDLARYFATTPSEILADLDRILLCGVPPYLPDDYIGVYVEEGRAEIRFADHFRRPFRFSPTEALALLMAIESLPEGGDDPHLEARRSLSEKFRRLLSRSLTAPEGRVDGRIETISGSGPTGGMLPARRCYRAALGVLKPAVETHHEVEIEYYSASKDATGPRVVRPYGFVEKQGNLYLVAHCKLSEGVRSFRVDRIRKATQLAATFEIPPRFSIERYEKHEMDFSKRFRVTARVRVRGERIVRWLQETRSGDLDEVKDGEAVVTIRAIELAWLVNEVLSYGPETEVLEPPEVRDALRRHLEDVLSAG
ncbi:helix-turn-helix transcriptional regulator [Planctomycetota bacterium]